ncbi:MAG: hypothetical protein RLY86_709 [Pseudomonadota bacterium]|jgi:putative ABC transport system permease protein
MGDFYLVRKNLFRKKLRAILMMVCIFVAFLLFGVLASFERAFNAGENVAAVNRLVVNNKINFTQPLPLAYLNRVRGVEGVALASHWNWFGGYFQEQRNFLIAFAVEPDTYLQLYREDFRFAEAEKATFLADRGAIAIGRAVANTYGWKVGDRIPLSSNIFSNRTTGTQTWDFTVAAIFDAAKEQVDTNQVFFHYDYFNESRTFGKDMVGSIIVETTDPTRNEAVIQAIDSMFANSPAETATVTEAAFSKQFAAQIGNIALIVTLVVGAAFITILMIVGNTMVMAIRERTREIGVLKTLGFPSPRIFRMVLGESMLLAFAGGIPGLVVAAVLCALLAPGLAGFAPGLALAPQTAALGVGLLLLLGLVTGLVPAVNALRLNIVSALGRD